MESGLLPGYFHGIGGDEPFDRRMKVLRREMAVSLDHSQRAPAAQFLNRTGIHASHDEPRRERMAISVPSVAVETSAVLPRCLKRRLGLLHRLREELVSLGVTTGEDRSGCVVGLSPP